MVRNTFIIGLTLLLLAASAGGAALGAAQDSAEIAIDISQAKLEAGASPIELTLCSLEGQCDSLVAAGGKVQSTFAQVAAEEEALAAELAALTKTASSSKNLSDETYEKIIVDRLGKAVYTHNGNNSSLMIFQLNKEDFRGYMAKIKLKNSNALRVTINPEDSPKGETPSQAAKRLGGIFAVNGGGFASATKDGVTRLVPLGNAMVEGELVGDFIPSWNDVAFAGFSKSNQLVGGIYHKEEELLASGAWQGVSFVPELMRDWEPQTIPSKWKSARQPRTVLGQYPNGDIFFIVVDGRQSNWSQGITLEEMQVLLLRLGIMEAFNLDGGGSSVMYYNGSILNKPSDGSQRRMATNIVIMP